MTDKTVLTFERYKGYKLVNVPASYLLYMYNENKVTPELKKYIEENKDVLKLENGR